MLFRSRSSAFAGHDNSSNTAANLNTGASPLREAGGAASFKLESPPANRARQFYHAPAGIEREIHREGAPSSMSPALQQAPASPSAEERAVEKVRARQDRCFSKGWGGSRESSRAPSHRRGGAPSCWTRRWRPASTSAQLRHQRVSPVVALALALLLSRGVAASAIAPARALAKQL